MTSRLSVLLLTLITLFTAVWNVASETCDVGLYYEVHHNTSMVSDAAIVELQTRTEFECVSECRFHGTCVSVNVRKGNTTGIQCTMFDVTSSDNDAVLREEPGVSYIELEEKKEGEREEEDCGTKMKDGCASSSGVYVLGRRNGETMTTYCDMETGTGGWTMVQRRVDGSVDFYRGWQEYKDGFGDPRGEFWLGLDAIRDLTISGDYTLRFDLWDDTRHRFAEYKNATVADEEDKYKLGFGPYTGDAGDSMTTMHKGREFSTFDNDNDQLLLEDCAEQYSSGWWYGACHSGNINGPYLNGTPTIHAKGIIWLAFRGGFYSMPRTEMKVKRV